MQTKEKKKIFQRKFTSVLKMHGVSMLKSLEAHFFRSLKILLGTISSLKTKFVLLRNQPRNVTTKDIRKITSDI